uniref:Uncharacterized protein n=1 Tax=Plectus sambesii TaxID=2011161 RepID=A0A914XDL3_9BILA
MMATGGPAGPTTSIAS